jgi:hypothetical protein
MAIQFCTPIKDGMIDDMILKLAGTFGTAGTATLRIYTGTQPETGPPTGSCGTGILLCEIINIGFNAASNGSAGMGSAGGFTGTAATDGTAGWGRLTNGGTSGTMFLDAPITLEGTSGFGMNDVVCVAEAEVTVFYFGLKIS